VIFDQERKRERNGGESLPCDPSLGRKKKLKEEGRKEGDDHGVV